MLEGAQLMGLDVLAEGVRKGPGESQYCPPSNRVLSRLPYLEKPA
jgi:hypothetical protein